MDKKIIEEWFHQLFSPLHISYWFEEALAGMINTVEQ